MVLIPAAWSGPQHWSCDMQVAGAIPPGANDMKMLLTVTVLCTVLVLAIGSFLERELHRIAGDKVANASRDQVGAPMRLAPPALKPPPPPHYPCDVIVRINPPVCAKGLRALPPSAPAPAAAMTTLNTGRP